MAKSSGGSRRLNDTAALASKPLGAGESHSISTRKIDNGYVVTTSSCNPDTGGYSSTERFTASAPRIIPGRTARTGQSPDGPNSLAGAMDYMKEKG
jgi:hypothetical protein